MKKVGLFFGSFNPVHNGHLMLANYMLTFVPLDEVWFVVSPQNPLKMAGDLWPEALRFQLVKAATAGFAPFVVSDIEFAMPKPSYTIDTLEQLFLKHPSVHFSLIMGSDSLESFHLWKSYDSILDKVRLLVYPRKGSDGGALKDHPAVVWLDAPLLGISSTFIRESLSAGKDIRFFLPPQVWSMIASGPQNQFSTKKQ